MRCLSLAIAARDLGVECFFVTSDDSFRNVIEQNGFKDIILHSEYKDIEAELTKMTEVINDLHTDILIVDSYFVTSRYLTELKRITKLAYIDDVKAFPYEVDILINYNAYALEMDYEDFYKAAAVALPETMILGEQYAPLRKEFQKLSPHESKREAEDIFFSAGGADPEHIAIRFARALMEKADMVGAYTFHFVIGSFEPDKDELQELAHSYKWLVLHENVRDMAELMRKCDIAVSAAGSTLYELCACGIPTITYILADNQIRGAKALSDKGIVISAGDSRTETDFLKKIIQQIIKLDKDYDSRCCMQKRAHHAIDGKGAEKIIRELLVI
jgi:UDP-2,4-diacetamido-2,4,6-trideoxy-beta-L-altropyranose hydrolase